MLVTDSRIQTPVAPSGGKFINQDVLLAILLQSDYIGLPHLQNRQTTQVNDLIRKFTVTWPDVKVSIGPALRLELCLPAASS